VESPCLEIWLRHAPGAPEATEYPRSRGLTVAGTNSCLIPAADREQFLAALRDFAERLEAEVLPWFERPEPPPRRRRR